MLELIPVLGLLLYRPQKADIREIDLSVFPEIEKVNNDRNRNREKGEQKRGIDETH